MKNHIETLLILCALSCGGDSTGTGGSEGTGESSSTDPTAAPTTSGSTGTEGETQTNASGGHESTTGSTGLDSSTDVDATTSGDCEPQTEVCNGVDDDCNDEIDDIGGACMVGVGACEAVGTQSCVDGMPACDAMPAMPSEELCNGLDDDCNGTADDAQLGACIGQMGACGFVGSTDCAGTCVGDVPMGGMPETCNGVDDDCDGGIDENLIFSPCADGGGICTCFESDANGNAQGSGPFDAYRTCAPGGGFYFWLCNPALGCADYPAGCMFGGFHP